MYPTLISGPTSFLVCIASALVFLSVGLALPHLAGSGDMALTMVWFFLVQPLSIVMLCVVLCVVCAQRARALGLARGWGLIIPALIALDWRWVFSAPMMLSEPSAFPFPPPFPWEACSAIVLIVAATILQAGAFSVGAMGARLAT